MEDLEKMLCKLIVPAVGDRGMELVELGHSMLNDSGDEMDKFGVELIQIGNHIADCPTQHCHVRSRPLLPLPV